MSLCHSLNFPKKLGKDSITSEKTTVILRALFVGVGNGGMFLTQKADQLLLKVGMPTFRHPFGMGCCSKFARDEFGGFEDDLVIVAHYYVSG